MFPGTFHMCCLSRGYDDLQLPFYCLIFLRIFEIVPECNQISSDITDEPIPNHSYELSL